jgi:predicted translin family RNA/ssDNA-binding protein
MLNKKFFTDLKKDYTFFNRNRREIIGWSSDALHKSKIAIFTLHRGQVSEAAVILAGVEKTLASLEPVFKKSAGLRHEGSYRAALEEYVEAKMLYKIMAEKKISPIKEVKVDFDSYLGGLCDTTGELVRLAIKEATEGRVVEVEKIRDIITDIMGELIEFNLTSYLRTKYDQAKTNLKKIEQIVYEIKLRKN